MPSPVRRRYTYVGHACVEESGHALSDGDGGRWNSLTYRIPAKVHEVGEQIEMCPSNWRRVLTGRPCHECSDDVRGVPIQRHPCPVVPHRRSWVGVRCRLLYVAERHPGVERGGDEGVSECVRTHGLGDPCTPRDASDDSAGAVAVEAAAVNTEEDRALAALTDCEIDRTGRAWGERDRDDFAAFTHNREGSMSAFEAERLDVGTGRL